MASDNQEDSCFVIRKIGGKAECEFADLRPEGNSRELRAIDSRVNATYAVESLKVCLRATAKIDFGALKTNAQLSTTYPRYIRFRTHALSSSFDIQSYKACAVFLPTANPVWVLRGCEAANRPPMPTCH
jgi:hypothetical protein